MPNTDTLLTEARKPLYASLGAGELAVTKLRELPAELQNLQKELPSQVRTLREQVSALQDKATSLYGELADRGEQVVGSLRGQQSTEDAEANAKKTGRTKSGGDAKATAKSAKDASKDAADKLA